MDFVLESHCSSYFAVTRATRMATSVWKEQAGRSGKGKHQCLQVLWLWPHIDIYVTHVIHGHFCDTEAGHISTYILSCVACIAIVQTHTITYLWLKQNRVLSKGKAQNHEAFEKRRKKEGARRLIWTLPEKGTQVTVIGALIATVDSNRNMCIHCVLCIQCILYMCNTYYLYIQTHCAMQCALFVHAIRKTKWHLDPTYKETSVMTNDPIL